jgi:hypothetical protein
MFVVFGQPPPTGVSWRKKCVSVLAGSALLASALMAAPAATAAPDTEKASVSAAAGFQNASITGSSMVGATVRLNIGDLGQATDWEVGWYIGDVVQNTDSGAADYPYAFIIPVTAAGKRLSVRGWVSWPDTGFHEFEVDAGKVAGLAFVAAPTPTFTGSAVVGKTLTAQPGRWSPEATLSYQWLRGGKAVAGATQQSYALTSADHGQPIAVRVTGVKPGYDTLTKTSAARVVAVGSITAPKAVSLSGAARVGSKLSAQAGTWAPKGVKLAYQWLRNGKNISGATKATYVLSASDLNKSVVVRVTASLAGYSTLSKTSAAKKVSAGSLKPAAAVKVSGTARFGSTLKIATTWPSGAKAAYQWYRGSSKIKGATKSTYRLTSADIGKKVKASVTVQKTGYSTYRTSAVSATVGKAVFSLKSAPKISGTKKAGATLTVSKGSYSSTPSSYSYQWYRGSAKIHGATKAKYTLTKSDVGKKISARVTVKRSNFSNKTSAAAAVAIPAPPKPVISRDGIYKVGTGIKPGLYKATGTGDSCYWETLNGFTGSLWDINNNYFGTANTYVRITEADRGFNTSDCGSWIAAPKTGANASKITKDGTYRIGIDIKAGTYVGKSNGASCYWATLDDFTDDLYDIRDNYYGSARTIIEIPRDVAGLEVSGCGTLVRE